MKVGQSQMIVMMIVVMMMMSVADQNLISSTCKTTPDKHLCTAIIRANRGAANADLPGLGLILVDAIKQKSNQALSIINKLTKTPALHRCTDAYKAVLEADIPVAQHSIRGNPKFAETAVADAGAEATICDRALGAKSPELSNVNKYVTRLAQVARAIIRNLL